MSVRPASDGFEERRWLEHVLTREIPLGGAMRLAVECLDDAGIVLAAPLAPNINDKGTAFGGALASLMILAGWSLPRLLLRRAGLEADLVIGRCRMQFLAPVTGSLRAACAWPVPEASGRFLESLHRRGRGRLELAPEIRAGDGVAARLEARYAALAKSAQRTKGNGESA
ncbi:MAG: YiiD C-terminal domain-containing protein [Wenzhouxiangellaceae bacterium]|nr:YiiD C-terminal domain-containing protein [Wenzhouxiangellaceae bacterium]